MRAVETYDALVVGLGPGGEDLAGRLAEAGLAVLGVDNRLVGGECPYWGCIPSKMMLRAADALAEARRVPALAGSTGEVRPDWSVVARRIREEATDDWDDQVAVDRLVGKGVTFVRGTGRISAPGVVTVETADGPVEYAARRAIVLNTGTTPAIPPIPGLADVPSWTNHEIIEAETLPASLAVLGGGAIGCELAQVVARFGVAVTLVEGADHLLPAEEPEAGEALAGVLAQDGIDVRLGVTATSVEQVAGGLALHLADGTTVTAERLLVATGRRADPEAAGLAKDFTLDAHCRVEGTGAEGAASVWVIGDLAGKGAFTHVSMYQAAIARRAILGSEGEAGPPASYHALPRVTFTEPEVGAVGLTEKQARERYDDVRVGSTPTPSTSRGWIDKVGNEGIIKVVAAGGVLVGGTVMGPAGGEAVSALAVAVHARVPLATLDTMIWAYPTIHRGIEAALQDLGEDA